MAQGQRDPTLKKRLNARLLRFTLISLGAIAVAAFLRGSEKIERIELNLMDTAQRLAPLTVREENRVVVVAVDDLSLDADSYALGKWPWPRDIYAPVLEYLAYADARMVGFDIYFPLSSAEPEDDRQFVNAVLEVGNTCQAAAAATKLGKPTSEEARSDLLERFGVSCDPQSPFDRLIVPFDGLRDACDCLGQLNAPRDVDGAKRRVSMLASAEGVTLPSLPLAMWLWVKERYPEEIVCVARTIGVNGAVRSIPIEEDGTAWLRFSRFRRTYLSFSSVLHAGLALREGVAPDWRKRDLPVVIPEMFENKVVIIAVTASGLFDLVSSPLGTVPGVELHAAAYENIEVGGFLKRLDRRWSWLAAAGLVLLGGLALHRWPTWIALPFGSILAMGYGALDVSLLRSGNWMDLSFPWLAFVLAEAGQILALYFAEGREKRRYRATFSRYVSKQVVEELLKESDQITLGGERREITVLFCDIRGFTTLSEHRRPGEVVGILNEFLGAMVEEVFAHGGTLDKFLGDGMMVFYGAPGHQADQAARAVRTGLGMRARLEELNAGWQVRGLPSLRIGIGVNTGPATVGNIGSKERMEYTAIGDTVNTASRVQALNKQIGTCILVTAATAEQCGDEIRFRSHGAHSIRGKTREVELFEPIGGQEAGDA